MQELKEKANKYAEENVINVLKEAFAKVYADGYRDGYKDREEEIPVDMRDGKTEYVDLGLPSGTLWAKTFEKVNGERLFLSYDKAKTMNLPTIDQWEELRTTCKWTMDSGRIYCIGPNGNTLRFATTGYIEAKETCICANQSLFWLLSEDRSDNSRKAGYVFYTNGLYKYTSDYFSGYKLPVRLVSKNRG